MHGKTISLLAVAAALVAGGCGADKRADDRADAGQARVSQVVDRLGAAARSRDAKAICEDLFTKNLQTSIRRTAGTSCAAEVGRNLFSAQTRFSVEKVDVGDAQAVALVKDQKGRESSLVLLPESGVWKIARIGSAADVRGLAG